MIRQLFIATIPLLLAAEPPGPQLSAPTLGYVFDDTAKSVRLVSGVPGAAYLDEPVAAGVTLEKAWVHSAARVAVGVAKYGGPALVRWQDYAEAVALDSSLGELTAAAFSRSGDFVVLTDGDSAEVWTALDALPSRVATHRDEAGIVAVAVNDAGAAAVANGSGLISILGGGSSVAAAGGDWTALAYRPNGTDLIAADAAGGALVVISNAASNPGRQTLAALPSAATAIAVSNDGALVGVSFAQGLAVVDGGGQLTPVECECSAGGLEQMAGNLVLYLAGGSTPQLLDADGAAPRLVPLPELHIDTDWDSDGGTGQ